MLENKEALYFFIFGFERYVKRSLEALDITSRHAETQIVDVCFRPIPLCLLTGELTRLT